MKRPLIVIGVVLVMAAVVMVVLRWRAGASRVVFEGLSDHGDKVGVLFRLNVAGSKVEAAEVWLVPPEWDGDLKKGRELVVTGVRWEKPRVTISVQDETEPILLTIREGSFDGDELRMALDDFPGVLVFKRKR